MHRDAKDLAARGLVAGTLATVPMSAFMLAAQALGRMGEQPPKKITDAAVTALEPATGHGKRRAWATLLHFAVGAASGAIFGALQPKLPAALPAPVAGAIYGSLVWLVSYAGWVPALGIMRPPHRDRRGRPSSMLVAHWVFGASLGAMLSRR